jgi:hypothetical protein
VVALAAIDGVTPNVSRNGRSGSGGFLTPSPPSEKATVRQDQTRQSGTGDRAWDGNRTIRMVMVMVVRGLMNIAYRPTSWIVHIKSTGRIATQSIIAVVHVIQNVSCIITGNHSIGLARGQCAG